VEDVGEVARAGIRLVGQPNRDPEPDRMAEGLQPRSRKRRSVFHSVQHIGKC
jgi:hypothetical protein